MRSNNARIQSALNDLREGKMILLTDKEDRENEGDLICAAEMITPNIMNFMIRHCSGIVCLALTCDQFKKLNLNYMVAPHENTSPHATPFTVSIEARSGVTTGVSAQDRTVTILTAISKTVSEKDIVKPGHVFPLLAREGGVFERQGHTEGAVDIARLAGCMPAAVLCEVMNPDGTMSKGKDLHKFAKKHRLKTISVDDILTYRLCHENLIEDEVTTQIPLEKYGTFEMSVLKEKYTGKEHIVFTSHKKSKSPLLVRIHSSCITGDLFGSKRCDCNKQLDHCLKKIGEEGGMLIYLNQEGRGIGLFNKIRAYNLQDKGLDTIEANQNLGLPVDSREYYIAANILKNKNVKNIRLLTNNPHKSMNLQKYGNFHIKMEHIPIFCNEDNKNYLRTKKEKMNHMMSDAI